MVDWYKMIKHTNRSKFPVEPEKIENRFNSIYDCPDKKCNGFLVEMWQEDIGTIYICNECMIIGF